MKHCPASTRGFALVIALSLMAFILLLILSITTLVRVESQSANIQLTQLEACMNARLGAMVALGDLQRYTGPDQRVTARSDILLAPGASGIAGQSRWTGVWSSKEITNDPLDTVDGVDDRQPRWLVSGNDNNPSAPTLDPSVALTVETIDLATLGVSVIDKSNINQDDTVKAPKVEILDENNVPAGHYAYWVGDEGVKARVNMADPFLDATKANEEYYFRTAMAQVADPTAVSNSEGIQLLAGTSSRWKDETQDPEKISSLKNIPMFLEDDLPGGTSLDGVNREFFHDFTVHSRGVLANTKDGGLKRDLSTALLSLPSDMTGPMFEPYGGAQSLGNPGGPNWEQLADYYQVAIDTEDSNSLQLRIPTTEQVGIAPVVTRWNLPFYGFADFNGAGDEWTTGGYNYSIGLFPLITLWNPYSKDLVLPEIGIECEFPRKMEIWSCKLSDEGTINSGLPNEVTYDRKSVVQINTSTWSSGTTYRNVIKFRIKPVTIPAGQAYNFTPPINSIFDYQGSNEGRNNILVPGGWSAGNMNGFYTDPIVGSGTEEFYYGAKSAQGARAPWMHRAKRIMPVLSRAPNQGGTPWRPVLNLYDLSLDSTFNRDGSNRFKSLTFWGMNGEIGDVINNNGAQKTGLNPRVVRLNRIDNLDALLPDSPRLNNSFLQPLGSSDGASYIDPGTNTAADLTAMDSWKLAGRTFGISAALKFPDMPYHSTRNGSDTDMELPIHLYRNFNPTAPVVQRPINAQEDHWGSIATMYTRGPSTRFGGDNTANYLPGTEFAEAPLGLEFGINSTSGSDEAILYDISKPLSIGHLMHANLFNFYGSSNDLEISNGSSMPTGLAHKRYHANTHQALNSIPTYAIGNSFPDINLPLDSTKLDPDAKSYKSNQQSNGVPVKWCHYDYSYELNSALWDGYYFSGIDPNEQVDFPLPNARLRDASYDNATSLLDEKQAASRLLLNGAFNINSTSIAAWESILGAMREIDNIDGGSASSADQLHNFSRFMKALADSTGTLPDLNSDADSIAAGFRSLSDAQIAILASAIVAEIRLRASTADSTGSTYPFTSVSNFVNRSLDTSTRAFALSGVLQAAIDKSGINGLESDSSGLWEAANLDYYPLYEEGNGNYTAEQRPRTDGMPGSLTQADLLNKIGHLLQARSDTFVIRSSGDTINDFSAGANQPSAQAYYEIIVQRTPEYVDSSQFAYDPVSPASSDTNLEFGRRYQIVSQGWVSREDI
jgi:hypothetical protein